MLLKILHTTQNENYKSLKLLTKKDFILPKYQISYTNLSIYAQKYGATFNDKELWWLSGNYRDVPVCVQR